MKLLFASASLLASTMSFAGHEEPMPAIGQGIVTCSEYLAALEGPNKEEFVSRYVNWFGGYAYALRAAKKVDSDKYGRMVSTASSPHAVREYCANHKNDELVEAFEAVTS